MSYTDSYTVLNQRIATRLVTLEYEHSDMECEDLSTFIEVDLDIKADEKIVSLSVSPFKSDPDSATYLVVAVIE
jgi:hypothetical protein